MEHKIKVIKERLKGAAIIGDTWQLVSMVQRNAVRSGDRLRRELQERNEKLHGLRLINAQMFKLI